jgi:hypothetical protein
MIQLLLGSNIPHLLVQEHVADTSYFRRPWRGRAFRHREAYRDPTSQRHSSSLVYALQRQLGQRIRWQQQEAEQFGTAGTSSWISIPGILCNCRLPLLWVSCGVAASEKHILVVVMAVSPFLLRLNNTHFWHGHRWDWTDQKLVKLTWQRKKRTHGLGRLNSTVVIMLVLVKMFPWDFVRLMDWWMDRLIGASCHPKYHACCVVPLGDQFSHQPKLVHREMIMATTAGSSGLGLLGQILPKPTHAYRPEVLPLRFDALQYDITVSMMVTVFMVDGKYLAPLCFPLETDLNPT